MAEEVVSSSVTKPSRRVVLISAGASHSVALLTGNIAVSWGRGEDGQLGHGDAEDRLYPTQMSALDGLEIITITCGADHATAYSESLLQAYSWGWGDFGRLGHGNSTDLFTPQPIKALEGVRIRQIACGDSHCLAVTMQGEVRSWGRNQNGQLGLGTTEDSLVPQKIQAFQGVSIKMVAAGAEHTAAITEDGELFGWGWGRYGNLGLGDRSDRLIPQKVSQVDGQKMVLVACGWRHTISVSSSGGLYTYGWSKYGQLGHGDFEDHLIPHQLEALRNDYISQVLHDEEIVLQKHETLDHFCVDRTGHVVFYNYVQGGTNGMRSSSIMSLIHVSWLWLLAAVYGLEGQDDINLISGGWRHTMAVTSDGKLYGWGWNKFGQVGVGDNVDHSSPVQVKFPQEQKVVQISCGWRHTLAITERQNIFSWGRGTNGQLGHGDTFDRNTPKVIEALSMDGSSCQDIESSKVEPVSGKIWVSPSERYAIVPDETVQGQSVVTLKGNGSDASVPESDVKRMRI